MTQVFRPKEHFGQFWPNGHADRWVRLPLWDFLAMLYRNRGSEMHSFFELGPLDGRTDGWTPVLLNAPALVEFFSGYTVAAERRKRAWIKVVVGL